ncbi:MAG: chromate transporter [Planctomycetota bacterium]|jgi:chromate transporter
MVMLKLFLAFSKISMFAFGGAYSFLPLMEAELVQNHQWLDESEFLEITGITKLFPGAISIKFATYTGYKIAGIPGVIIANFANLLPPILFVMLASLLYSRHKDIPSVKAGFEMVQYALFALIIAVAVQLVDKSQVFQLRHIIIILASFGLFYYAKVHPAFIIIAAGILGAVLR